MLKFLLVAFFVFNALAQDSNEVTPEELECMICLSDIRKCDWENEFGLCHGDCFIQWLEMLINDGNFAVPLFHQFRQFDSDRTVQFYENEEILKFLYKRDRADLADKLSRSIAKNTKIRDLAGIPCSYGDCDGMFINATQKTNYLPVGQQCPLCERFYKAPQYDKKTLRDSKLCPNCRALIIRIGGCNNTHCGNCRQNFDWQSALDAAQVYKQKKPMTCIIF